MLVPVVGDHARETEESLELLIGNPVGATLGRDHALVSVADDDGPNRGRPLTCSRSPADRSAGVAAPATLSWSASDPDAWLTRSPTTSSSARASRAGRPAVAHRLPRGAATIRLARRARPRAMTKPATA